MAAAVAWWRAGVQCGHEGHAQSPRVCVLEWGWPLCLLPQAGMEPRSKGGTGRDFPLLAPPPAQGREVVLRQGWKRGYCPGRGRFPRPLGKPALFNDEAARQVLREVLEELGCGSRAVGQLQLLQLLQLHKAR